MACLSAVDSLPPMGILSLSISFQSRLRWGLPGAMAGPLAPPFMSPVKVVRSSGHLLRGAVALRAVLFQDGENFTFKEGSALRKGGKREDGAGQCQLEQSLMHVPSFKISASYRDGKDKAS